MSDRSPNQILQHAAIFLTIPCNAVFYIALYNGMWEPIDSIITLREGIADRLAL